MRCSSTIACSTLACVPAACATLHAAHTCLVKQRGHVVEKVEVVCVQQRAPDEALRRRRQESAGVRAAGACGWCMHVADDMYMYCEPLLLPPRWPFWPRMQCNVVHCMPPHGCRTCHCPPCTTRKGCKQPRSMEGMKPLSSGGSGSSSSKCRATQAAQAQQQQWWLWGVQQRHQRLAAVGWRRLRAAPELLVLRTCCPLTRHQCHTDGRLSLERCQLLPELPGHQQHICI